MSRTDIKGEEFQTWRNPEQICLVNTQGEIVAWGYSREVLQSVVDWLNSDGEGFTLADGFADRGQIPALYTWLESKRALQDFFQWQLDNAPRLPQKDDVAKAGEQGAKPMH